MKSLTLLAAAAALALSVPAWAQNQTPPMAATPTTAQPVTAKDFVTKAAISDNFEIQSSKIAQQKTKSDAIKAFAQKMIDDHTKSTNDLMTVLKAPANASIQPPNDLDDQHKQMLTQLNQAAGTDFDRLYTTMQVAGHKEAVDLFTNYSQKGVNADLKSFAGRTLPTIQMHYQMAQQLQMQAGMGMLETKPTTGAM